MEKDFKNWMTLKEKLDNLPTQVLFRAGEIWWVAIGCNIGGQMVKATDSHVRS